MTNVSVNNNNNPKIILSRRIFLALAFGAALMSLCLFGTAHHRMNHSTTPASDLGPDVLYSPFLMDSHAVSVLRDLELLQDQTSALSSPFNLRAAMLTQPEFTVQESDEAVTVTAHVPETVRLEDIDVQVREGSILHIQGGRSDKYSHVSFEKTFALGRHMDADAITASLSRKGILTVKAPKFPTKQIDTIRKIDITKTEF